jgi:hypothetical protein
MRTEARVMQSARRWTCPGRVLAAFALLAERQHRLVLELEVARREQGLRHLYKWANTARAAEDPA